MSNWTGIAGPCGIPEATTGRLSAAVTAAVRSERVSAALRAQGIIPCSGTSREFASFILDETEKWRPIVAQLHNGGDIIAEQGARHECNPHHTRSGRAGRDCAGERAFKPLETLQGKVVGFIDNSKPNFNYLVDDLAELLSRSYGVARVVKHRKRGRVDAGVARSGRRHRSSSAISSSPAPATEAPARRGVSTTVWRRRSAGVAAIVVCSTAFSRWGARRRKRWAVPICRSR